MTVWSFFYYIIVDNNISGTRVNGVINNSSHSLNANWINLGLTTSPSLLSIFKSKILGLKIKKNAPKSKRAEITKAIIAVTFW